MHKHLKEQLVPPDHINKTLSVGVAEVIESMMAKDRDLRYESVKLVLEDLHNIQDGQTPLHAHKKFDSDFLEDLEKGSDMDEELEGVLSSQPQQLGLQTAVIILVGMLLVAVLIIFMLMAK